MQDQFWFGFFVGVGAFMLVDGVVGLWTTRDVHVPLFVAACLLWYLSTLKSER